MIKTTQRVIKQYRTGDNDLTYRKDAAQVLPPERARQIAYSVGIYGCNGLLLQDMETGEFFTICARTTTLYLYL